MADAIDDILSRQNREEQTTLRQAEHDASWSRTFVSTPPAEVLRSQLHVESLIDKAFERKMRLRAQTDSKAADVLMKNAQLQDYERNAPLRQELLNARIDHDRALTEASGASTRYKQQLDTQTQQQVSRFYKGAAGIKSQMGTSQHAEEFFNLLADNPLAAMTSEVGEYAKTHSEAHVNSRALIETRNKMGDLNLRATNLHGIKIEELASPLNTRVNAEGKPDPQGEFLNVQSSLIMEPAKKIPVATAEALKSERDSILGVPSDPKKVLAREALDDPDAPEEVKARARKILGQ